MRWSILFFSSPRQYAPAMEVSLNASGGSSLVLATCGPRHRSVKVSCV